MSCFIWCKCYVNFFLVVRIIRFDLFRKKNKLEKMMIWFVDK